MKKVIFPLFSILPITFIFVACCLGGDPPIDPFKMTSDGTIRYSDGLKLAKKTLRTEHVELGRLDRDLEPSDYSQIGGVLLRTYASLPPNFDTKSISLSFSEKAIGERQLQISFTSNKVAGQNQEFVPDMPIWVWATAARFADSQHTALITRFWRATNDEERLYEASEKTKGNAVNWIGYHEAVEDSLVGVLLLMADFVSDPAFLMNFMSDDLISRLKSDNYYINNDIQRQKAALLSLEQKFDLYEFEWETYMLNDIEANLLFCQTSIIFPFAEFQVISLVLRPMKISRNVRDSQISFEKIAMC